ncbi:MAG TPA: hypothetical protein PLG59_11530 [bacterium]|nr:hypothetical protein [bacterium]HQO35285.1 hypothetical protein [bacterium]HQP99851.1 hypothetical protein [bacterium]
MNSPGPNRWDAFVLAALLCLLNAIVLVDIRHFAVRGLHSQLEESLQLSHSIVENHQLPQAAFYPPGVPFLLAVAQFAGWKEINPFVFNAILLNLGVLFFYALARMLLRGVSWAFGAVLLMILNPYFVSTSLLSRDTAAEFLFTGLFFLFLFGGFRSGFPDRQVRSLFPILLFVIAAVLALVRVTGFFSVLILFAACFLLEKPLRRVFGVLLALWIVFALLFMLYNHRTVGSFTLATNAGTNLYLGNHPLYLHGHPHYDIDAFLETERIKKELSENSADGLSEAQLDAYFKGRAFEAIRANIPAFLYRVLVKTVWHWFNFEIIPNYTSRAYLEGGENRIVVESRIGLLTGLAYMIYKFAYLPLFLWSIIVLLQKKIDLRMGLFYLPYLALWPIVVLTFPDTRFKIVAEVCVLIPMIAVVQYRWFSRTPSL